MTSNPRDVGARLPPSFLRSTARIASRFAPGFNFTAAQWLEIRKAVWAGCAQPSRFDAGLLLREVNDYLSARTSYQSPSAQAKAFRRVAGLMEQARAAVATADPSGRWRAEAHLFVPRPRPAERLPVSEILELWRRSALEAADVVPAESAHPRSLFFQHVLDCWQYAGGWLRFSRGGPESKSAGKLSGPTVRYMLAVCQPVMRKDAPTAEAIRKIIDRCAEHFEDVLCCNDVLADVMEAIQAGKIEDIRTLRAISSKTRATSSKAKNRLSKDEARVRARLLVRGSQRAAL